MEITAPAKINLYLDILDKRDDGYHEIETLFERVSIYDELSVTAGTDDGLTYIYSDNDEIPTGEGSLLMRAVDLFKERSGSDTAFRVELTKRIPIGAGMGGGSSDAAALLKGLNEVSGKPLLKDDLVGIGANLGADIPFFLEEASFGIGRGRGDVIQKLDIDARIGHIIINPPFKVMTADIYNKVSRFDLTKKRGVDRMFTAFLSDLDIQSIGENLHNGLQDIVLRDFPSLEQVFSELRKIGALGVLLSGSGPTVFGIFDEAETKKAYSAIKDVFPGEEGWQVFEAYTA